MDRRMDGPEHVDATLAGFSILCLHVPQAGTGNLPETTTRALGEKGCVWESRRGFEDGKLRRCSGGRRRGRKKGSVRISRVVSRRVKRGDDGCDLVTGQLEAE
jgi:hypothetical protein